jgi:3-oxoadipate CoA-transferase, beta subunit
VDAKTRLSRDRIAQLIARDLKPGSYVNLGIGIPTKVAAYLDPRDEIILHSENGILGFKELEEGQPQDVDLLNASKGFLQLIVGTSICDQATSFAMMRGGHLDATVLGAFQVASNGDVANWITDLNAVPAVGGAMDLVVGAKSVIIAMEHTTRDGQPRLLESLTYPVTGLGVVTSVYTDMAIIDVVPDVGFVVRAQARDVSEDALRAATGAPLRFAEKIERLDY